MDELYFENLSSNEQSQFERDSSENTLRAFSYKRVSLNDPQKSDALISSDLNNTAFQNLQNE